MRILLFLLILLQGVSFAQTMDFEKYNPPSTLVVPEHPINRASIPFLDVHSHHWRMSTQDLDELIAEMDELNMGAVVNLSGRGGSELEAIMKNVRESGYEDRIIVFTNLDFNNVDVDGWVEKAVTQLEQDVENGARGLKVFKSLGIRNTDSKGERIRVDDARLDPIWAKCGELGIPVLIHSADPQQFWMPMTFNNERWLELKTHPRRQRGDDDPVPWETIIEEQHNVFRKHRYTTFINAHFGWYANNLEYLGNLLDELPNIYIEFGAVIAELGRQPRMANQFFTKYQDRILFGKDYYKPSEYATYFRVLETEDEYFPYYKKYHAFWRMYGLGLDRTVLEKVYYKNALKVIPGLKPEVFAESY